MRRIWVLRVTLLLVLLILSLMVVTSDTARPKPSPIQQPNPTPFVLRLISDPKVKEVQEAHFMIKAEHPTGIKAGTGVAVDQELILTVFHLVGSNKTGEITATEIRITQPHMPWKEWYALAEVVATDPSLDLAVLKFERHRKLPSLSFGDPSQLRPGEVVYLIGHEFFPDGVGLLYPRDAEIAEGFAPESPFFGVTPWVIRGFSGGGVFNLQHELVGIAIKDYILFDTIKEGDRTYKIVEQGTIVTRINWAIHLLKKEEKQRSQSLGFIPKSIVSIEGCATLPKGERTPGV
ncbi:MAG: hypothetical protein GTO24_14930 [candidate division Zixibacteria bacterium]|nr:hypothetical protein [candidate division Zixibacteria bacterium]